jgi:PAS domain S-box-containing protein
MGLRPRSQPKFWTLILILVLMTIAIALSGVVYYQDQRHNLERSALDQLNAVSYLKIQQITAWLGERLADADLALTDESIAGEAQPILNGKPVASNIIQIQLWMRAIQNKYQYADVFLMDLSAKTLISASGQFSSNNPDLTQLASQAIRERKVVSSDLYRDPYSQKIYLDLIAPLLFAPTSQTTPQGVIVFRSDADGSLYPLLQSWPTASPSAETLLLRPAGSQVLLLNNLRQQAGTALTLTLPLDASPVTDVSAITSEPRAVSGVDYRGVQVLAEQRPIPQTPWILVTKIDQDEVYAPLAEKTRSALLLELGLIFTAITATTLLWRARELRHLGQIEREGLERQALMVHYQFLTKSTHDIILLMDEGWHIIAANDCAHSAYGTEHESLIGQNLSDLHADNARVDFEVNRRRLQENDGVTYETFHRRFDGSKFPVECSLRAISIEDARFCQAIVRDTSERKRTQQALQESEKRFRIFYEQAPISYQALAQDGTIQDVNWAWTDFLGYTHEEAVGHKFTEFLTEDAAQEFLRTFTGYKTLGEILGAEYAMRCKNGQLVYVRLNGKVNFDDLGQCKQIHCVLHDITDQKQTEERIHRINEELEQRVIQRTTQLEAANKELEAFSYSVSHDLRAPLRAIDGFSRILVEEFKTELSEDAQRYLRIICENTESMARLIDDLLVFSRLNRQPLKKVTVKPTELVQQSLEMLEPDTRDRQIEFNIGKLPACQADPTLLKQVYVNLLSNAIKFTRRTDKAVIEVGSLREDGHVIYYVKDNGVGFDMQYAPKLFGVFQRLHRVEDYEGTGVGLAIVQRIIHRHGGRVWAEGSLNQGATFCFNLNEEHSS